MSYTLLAFHAHPDDEALLTSGTMARAAAEGHRVILVVATDGELGLASQAYVAGGLAARRRRELETSARELGVARVEHLGYADSG
ncbi:MAG TPA: PIG-L family deacetylase, partial [Intrasporangium sp.]|nr:PIG-L family deacetylase [Intrasporangium sp.]